MSDWKDIEDVNQPCSESNGWCGWCGNCQNHSEYLMECEPREWENYDE